MEFGKNEQFIANAIISLEKVSQNFSLISNINLKIQLIAIVLHPNLKKEEKYQFLKANSLNISLIDEVEKLFPEVLLENKDISSFKKEQIVMLVQITKFLTAYFNSASFDSSKVVAATMEKLKDFYLLIHPEARQLAPLREPSEEIEEGELSSVDTPISIDSLISDYEDETQENFEILKQEFRKKPFDTTLEILAASPYEFNSSYNKDDMEDVSLSAFCDVIKEDLVDIFPTFATFCVDQKFSTQTSSNLFKESDEQSNVVESIDRKQEIPYQ